MIWLILGLLLWSLPHMFKRLAPEARARLGDRARGGVALVLVLSIVLMVIGYRTADGPVWWGRSPATTGINNLLVLIAVYLFAASGLKTRITRSLRHPQLTAVSLWAVAHLLVNGDLPSFVLFGGLLVWALAEMALINRAEPAWTPPPPAPRAKEIRAIVGTVIVYAVIAGIHTLLGYNPFG
ncbi:NnrU family protein [Wenxinia marina]|uniref:Putative membrane protein n=1 Tax=Wenxinia marina DSM 24838 TaxID=1123501 RepID=A0A0D0PGM1_9RHOB|nr:NnrU family protein [Wenxinia marina]KIQ70496.1 putative membrane protein [Wenxinia marina DSM 24838]GGL52653.1 membrane protein [Wenxinia marina]